MCLAMYASFLRFSCLYGYVFWFCYGISIGNDNLRKNDRTVLFIVQIYLLLKQASYDLYFYIGTNYSKNRWYNYTAVHGSNNIPGGLIHEAYL